MQRVQTEYSRWFNRTRRRDGTLVRGRFTSKFVDSVRYRRAVVSYIDRNPVSAGLVEYAHDYPHGSARAYGHKTGGEPWLNRTWVESCVCTDSGLDHYDSSLYPKVFDRLPRSVARVVETRLRSRGLEDPLDDLVASSPARIVEWMRRKARLADGVEPGLPVVDLDGLEEALREIAPPADRAWKLDREGGWELIRIALSRELCGESLETIAARLGRSMSTVSRACRIHETRLENAEYALRAALVAHRALQSWNALGSDSHPAR
jgi:hypothetical protein